MDEELEQRKISPRSFFEQVTKARETADRALEFSEDNLGVIEETKTSLEGIKFAIEDLKQEIAEFDVQGITQSIKDLKLEVKEINNYITVERKIAQDVQEDLRLETEDTEQKQERKQRLEEMGVPSSDGEQPQPTPAQQVGNALQDNIKQGGAVGGMLGAGLLQLLAPLLGAAMIPGSLAMGLPKVGALGFQNIFKGGKGDKGDGNFITRFFNRDKKSEKDFKEEIKSEIKKELSTRFDRDTGKAYVNDQEVDLEKYQEFKRLSPKDQLDQGLDFFKEGSEVKEKKDNRVMNFIKKGGVAGFLGRKLFGKKDNKAQEVGATNPEDKDSSYSESFSYEGRLDPATLEFIPDEGSLPPGVTLEKAQQDVYKSKIEMIEFDFAENVMRGMTREQAIKTYGPQSNLYRFKENYNKTLEYGGYELDVGKHYDSVKNSYSSSGKKGKKRGIKGVIGGVADSLTGGFFDFDKRGDTKTQDFAQGTADTLTGGIFDFDEKGSTKLQRFGQGFVDAVTGNLTDLDRKGGKTVGPTRALTGMADFFTADMFDLDKRGKMDLFGIRERMEKKKREAYQNNPRVKEFNKRKDELYDFKSKIPMETTISPDGSISSKGSGTLIGDELFTPGQPLTENQKMRIQMGLSMGNTYSEEIMKSYNMETVKSEKSIKPIIESDNKNLQSNLFQPMDSSPTIIVANNDGSGEVGDDQTVRVPASQPNTQDSGELVMTDDPSSFLKTIKNEQLNIASSNTLPHQVAQNLK